MPLLLCAYSSARPRCKLFLCCIGLASNLPDHQPGQRDPADDLLLCSHECEHVKLRRGEKTLLNGINKRLSTESLDRSD